MLQDLIDLLSPHLETLQERRALVNQALGRRSPLLNHINYEGSTHSFVVNTLVTLAQEPEALDALLDVVKDQVGVDQAQNLEALRPTLHGWAASGASLDALESKTSSLHAETTKSILISYSRRDRDAVLKLYADLKELGFTLWRDLHDIQGGEPFWEEIKKGIDACESLVLCMSPDALNSQFVQAEWQYARQQGKRVVPVVVAEVDFAAVPRWMSRLDWKDFREGRPESETVWASFIRTLNTPYSGHKVPFMVQPLPPYFVQRPTEFDALVNALVDQQGAVAITAAVKGAGGFGKTTLAMALCHDTRIKGAFDDGILWVTLGEAPTEADLIRKASDLTTLLTGQPVTVTTREAVKAELTKAIADRYILLVIDDLWRKADADLFLTGAKNSATLITTRLDAQLPDDTRFKQTVDAMRLEQAVKLLTWGIEGVETGHQSALQSLVQRLGEWAVLVRLVNGTLRKRIQSGESLAKALEYAAQALTRKGLNAFNSSNPQGRSEAVHSTLKVSVDLLTADQQAQFAQLAIFPEDVDIPFTTLKKAWQLDDFDTEAVAIALNDAGLLLNFELEQRTIRLHDVIRQYLIDEHRANLRQWQADFIAALDLHALLDEYVWRNVAYHLREADQSETLRGLLLDFNWLQAKLNATDANALLADFGDLIDDEPLRLVESALSMSAHIISEDKTKLALQLYGRLLGYREKQSDLTPLFEATSPQQGYFHLLHPTLGQAGGPLIRTIPLEYSGHALAITDDGEHVVVAERSNVKVFKWATGELLTTFTQHKDKGWVNGVSVKGELAFSASYDQTVKVWRWATGELLTNFTQHTDAVNDVSVQGELAFSASADKTVKVWRWDTGELLTDFTHHTDNVLRIGVQGELAFSASSADDKIKVWRWATGELISSFDQRYVNALVVQGELAFSASQDRTIKVWRWATGELVFSFDQAHVNALAVQGELVFSADKTVKVWRWDTGELLTDFAQHTSHVNALAVQGDLAFSVSADKTVKVWRWDTGELLTDFTQHTGDVLEIAVQGELAFSASQDKTIKVWRWATGKLVSSFDQHTGVVYGVAVQWDLAFSASADKTVKVWRWATGELLTDFTQHEAIFGVSGLNVQGELVFSADKTVKVWRWTTGELLMDFTQHTDNVLGIAVQGDLAFSASADKTVKVWRWTTGGLLTDFTQHTDSVNAVVVQGELAFSASWDQTVKVWRWATGELLADFTQHTESVHAVRVYGELAFSASKDETLKVWHWTTGEVIATFTADAPLICLAFEPQQRILLAGDEKGHVHVLRVVGLDHLLFPDGE